jgi:chromate transport protein ChrA
MNHITLTLLGQGAAPGDIGSRLAGLAGGLAGGLAVVAVSAITAVLIWQLLAATLKNPTPEKLAMIVAVALLAVFFVGATPDLVKAAYAYGQSFLR